MGAPGLDVDWEAVRAHAITHGVREAARAFGLKEVTVCQRSAREGWLQQAGVAIIPQPLPKSMQKQIVSNVISPSAAAKNSIAAIGGKSKLFIAKAVQKGAKHAAKLDGKDILGKAPQLKALAETGDKVFGWSGQGVAPVLRLELIAGSVGPASQEELPAIDVEAEVEQLGSGSLPAIDGTTTNP